MTDLTAYERMALKFLARSYPDGGFLARDIAKQCQCGSSRSQLAAFRVQVLEKLLKEGRLKLLDTQSPKVYCITEQGLMDIGKTQEESVS